MDGNHHLNTLYSSQHQSEGGAVPDVMIHDLLRRAAYPDGRELTDNVCDLAGLPDDLTSENDVPFRSHVPFLARPHKKKIRPTN